MSQKNTNEPERIIPIVIEDELKSNFLDYAMSVIVSRALPDIRDGLKPVHRRVLYTMTDLGLQHGKPFKKCARIVGDCLGKYHPHGDTSVYDALVRMAQPWSLRYPLIKGQGNFGSIDGDSAAAMRYCITGKSLILTDKGILPIDNISNKQEAKINMKILSYNGKKNTASKFFNSGKHNIIELKTNLGYKILGSYNHPIMCWTLNGIPKIEWKLLENITKKDVVILNRNNSLFSKKDLDLTKFTPKKKQNTIQFNLPKKMNKDLAFLLGSLVAEGSFHQKKIIFNNLDMDYYNKVKNIIYEQFEGIQIYERKIAGNCLELEIYHQHVVNFLKNIGLKEVKSDKKEIPFSVLQSTKKVVVEFLKSLFEGDGSVKHKVDKRHSGQSMELTYNSKSEKLIEQLKILLLNFGIVTTSPYKDKRNNCYKLIISGYESIKVFKNKINFFSNRKVTILEKIDSMNSRRMSKTDFIPYISEYIRKKYKSHKLERNNFDRYNNLEKNIGELLNRVDKKDADLLKTLLKRKYLFLKVKEIKKLAKKEKVYSIKVDSRCHSFVANGFINHNTEARLEKISTEILTDIDKDTVDFRPNFDDSLNEPVILPSKTPNLLINGSSGIAVGMATNIPPHNLKEVCRAVIMTIENPEISILQLTEVITGPDFPTGGLLCGDAGIKQAYNTGKGKVRLRARIEIEEKKGRTSLIIKEIPYMVNKSLLLQSIADLVKKKIVTDLAELRDESDRDGMRVVLTLKKNSNPDIVMNQLFKHSRLESVYGVRFLALVNNIPRTLNLKSMIDYFIEHRVVIITRKTKYELKKAKQRTHILEGLIIALNNIDKVIDRIKKSKNAEVALAALIRSYKLSVDQAKAILDMRLQRLAALEQQKIKSEHGDLLKTIAKLEMILADKKKVLQIIIKEQEELIEKYGDERRTDIIEYEEDIDIEDLIEEEDVVVTISHSGYIKRMQLNEYRQQMRGGKGVIGAEKKEEDFLEHLFIANTHSYLLIFTDKGKIYWLKVYRIPEVGRYSKGKAIVNLVGVEKDETISAVIPVKKFDENGYLIFATKRGLVKKTRLRAYSRPRRGGIWAINLRPGDDVIDVVKTNGEKQLIIATRHGMAVRFNETDVRSVSRHSFGVRGIRLKKKDDRVIGMVVADETKTLLTVTEHGYGKRTPIGDYRLINRGGSGVINIKTTERNGRVVTIKAVDDETGLMFISVQGQVIRTSSKFISVISRNTQGVRLMRMNKGDKVADAAKIIG